LVYGGKQLRLISQKPGQFQVTVEHVRGSEEREQTVARKKQNMAGKNGGTLSIGAKWETVLEDYSERRSILSDRSPPRYN
jgi:hypothetical protein